MTEPLLHLSQWPDPSVSTTDLIQREASVLQRGIDKVEEDWRAERGIREENRLREQAAQQDKFEITIAGIKDTFAAEIAAINEATALQRSAANRIPDDIKSAVTHHESLQLERFKSIDLRFIERDVRTQQAAESSQKALDAALLAAAALVAQQNEANSRAADKVELAFTKQFDQIADLLRATQTGNDQKFGDLKERIDRSDGVGSGQVAQRTERRSLDSVVIALGGMLLVAIGLYAALKK